jgi:hypothetical protein
MGSDDPDDGERAMKTYQVLVLTEPAAGMEDGYNDYYENRHLDEVLSTAGWKSAQRFRLGAQTAPQVGEACPLPYLAIYEAQAESADEVLAVLNDTRPQRQRSDTVNGRTGRVWVFEPIGPRHEA